MARPKKQTTEVTVMTQDPLIDFNLTAEVVAGKLSSNAVELRKAIEQTLQLYNVDRYIDDPEAAKKDKAFLSKAQDQVKAKRIEITKIWNKPLDDFLNEMKSIEGCISDSYSKLNAITKEAENKEKEIKRSQIKEYYDGLNFVTVPFEKIFNEKWLNKSVSLKKIISEIDEIISNIKNDIATIGTLEDKDDILPLYLETLNLTNSINEFNRLKELKEKAKQLEAAKEIEKEPVKLPENVPVQEKSNDNPVLGFKLIFGNEAGYSKVIAYCLGNGIGIQDLTVTVTGHAEKLKGLRQFIDGQQITYRKG